MNVAAQGLFPHKQWTVPGRIVAVPSWVRPGSIIENCLLLEQLSDEVGLLFFESAASLAEPLPAALAKLRLRYHVHLPLDLPMHAPLKAAEIVLRLLDKVLFLDVRQAVIHPPAGDSLAVSHTAAFLDYFTPRSHVRLLWENIRGNDLSCLRGLLLEQGQGICLDLGHILAYEQEKLLLDQSLTQQAGMLHLNVPGQGAHLGRHLSLCRLRPEHAAPLALFLAAAPEKATLMLELFSLESILSSLPLLRRWFTCEPEEQGDTI